jgi:hypothetical protein
MKAIYRNLLAVFLVLVFIALPFSNDVQPVLAAGTDCVTSSPVSAIYSVTVCITSPADGATLTGNANITGTVNVIGPNPGVQRFVFYLNSDYVLTDFSSPYTFILPTNKWVDGTYTLSAEALMRDSFTTAQASISIIFNTGTSTPPVNNNTFQPATGTTPAAGQPFVVAATGDGAGGEANEASVTNLVSSMNPNLFLYLGDVYEKGSIAEFFNWYDPSTFFGRFRSITDPTVGNHDYSLGNSSAYRNYWDNVPDYYSFDAGGWHFISLNSYSQYIDVGPTSAEYQWLQQDLASNTLPCTIAVYHHPYLSIGEEGGRPALSDIWSLLAQNQVDIVLNGHDHDYERWVPLNDSGQPSSDGMTQFIVGTGGHSLQPIESSDSRVAYSNSTVPTAYGALRLQLYPTVATYSFMSISGSVLDSGTIICNGSSTISVHTIYLPLIFR